MSQLVAPTHTVVDSIPLGRRIMEIMSEKGSAYTISAMATRVGMSRETLRLMLKGEREVYSYELEKIAKDLKVTVERILQTDILSANERLQKTLSEYINVKSGVELAEEIQQYAIGLSERFSTANNVGRAWYAIRDYEKAHETWLDCLPMAQKALADYGDPQYIMRCTSNLSITYAGRQDYAKLIAIVTPVQSYFDLYPIQSGIICFSMAMYHSKRGEMEESLTKLYQYLNYCMMTKILNQIMKAKYNVAVAEYIVRKYAKAEELLVSIIESVDQCKDPIFICELYQEYGKVLFRLNKIDQSKQYLLMASNHLRSITLETTHYIAVEQQLYVLLSLCTQDIHAAEKLVHCEEYSLSARKIARKFLIDHYDQAGKYDSREYYKDHIKFPYTGIDMMLSEKMHDANYLLTLYDVSELVGWNIPK